MVRYAGLTRGQSHGQPGGEGMTKQRLTKQQAGEHFGVSVTTLDRMIRRGDLQIERDGPGERAKVWVLLDEEQGSSSGSQPDSQPGGQSRDAELEVLQERVKNLEELSEYRAHLLREAELRYHELLQQMASSQRTVENLTRVLPAAEQSTEERRRRWWPFGRAQ